MGFNFYKSATDTGNDIGDLINSGIRGALFPKTTSQQRLDGAVIIRKIFIESSGVTLPSNIGLSTQGIFGAVLFDATTDTQLVSEIVGTEDKYGASLITQLEDSASATETVNGVGGLINILKIRVEKNLAGHVLFRTGDKINIFGEVGTISTVTDQTTTWEITLVSSVPYSQCIGTPAFSYNAKTLTIATPMPFWIQIDVPVGASTSKGFNVFGISLVY